MSISDMNQEPPALIAVINAENYVFPVEFTTDPARAPQHACIAKEHQAKMARENLEQQAEEAAAYGIELLDLNSSADDDSAYTTPIKQERTWCPYGDHECSFCEKDEPCDFCMPCTDSRHGATSRVKHCQEGCPLPKDGTDEECCKHEHDHDHDHGPSRRKDPPGPSKRKRSAASKTLRVAFSATTEVISEDGTPAKKGKTKKHCHADQPAGNNEHRGAAIDDGQQTRDAQTSRTTTSRVWASLAREYEIRERTDYQRQERKVPIYDVERGEQAMIAAPRTRSYGITIAERNHRRGGCYAGVHADYKLPDLPSGYCDGCRVGNSQAVKGSDDGRRVYNRPGQGLAVDAWGPINPPDIFGNQYAVTVRDMCTRKRWLFTLQRTSQWRAELDYLIRKIENHHAVKTEDLLLGE